MVSIYIYIYIYCVFFYSKKCHLSYKAIAYYDLRKKRRSYHRLECKLLGIFIRLGCKLLGIFIASGMMLWPIILDVEWKGMIHL